MPPGTPDTPDNTNPRPRKTYPRPDGTRVPINVPDDPDPEDLLVDAIKGSLSARSIAVIATLLGDAASIDDPGIRRQVGWFADRMAQAVGGWERQAEILRSINL